MLFLCEEPDGATALRTTHETDQCRALWLSLLRSLWFVVEGQRIGI